MSTEAEFRAQLKAEAVASFAEAHPQAAFYYSGGATGSSSASESEYEVAMDTGEPGGGAAPTLGREGLRITRVYGSKFGGGSSPEDAAEQFRSDNALMFGVEPADLHPQSLLKDRRHTQPVMYDRETGEYKFTLVYFSQFKDDVPVYRADLRLLARNEEGAPLVLASANLRDLGDFSPALDSIDLQRFTNRTGAAGSVRALADQPPVAPQDADDSEPWETAARELVPSLTNFSEPELVIWAGVDDTVAQPALAVTFTGNNRGTRAGATGTGATGSLPAHALADQPPVPPQTVPIEAWRFVADVATGAILHRESLIHHFEDVYGNVSGMATQGIGADVCEVEAQEPMPYAHVNIFGELPVIADENGDFCIPNEGTDPVTVESRVWEQYFRVHNYNGTTKHADHDADTLLDPLVTPPGPAVFIHNQTNVLEFERAEVNAYVHANIIRDAILEANPTFPDISTETEFTINVNRVFACIGFASYDPGTPPLVPPSMSFCPDQEPCSPPIACGFQPNTAFSSIVYHEYGHRLMHAGTGVPDMQGQYGEGIGDTMSVIILDDECVGLGIPWDSVAEDWDCTVPTGCVRNADNEVQYPCSGSSHECAPLLSGCVWDTREELVVTEPLDYQDILMSLAVNSVMIHGSSTLITPQITIDWLILDDDDTCFWDGTPHYDEICTGFGAHNMGCPCLADFNGDGEVEAFDLGFLLGAWGPCPAPPAACLADLDCDGTVEAADLGILLGAWGPCTGGGDSGGSGGDGSLTLEQALALMDYESVDAFITWLVSSDNDEAFEAVQYLHSLLTDGP